METQKEVKKESIFRKKALDRVSSPEELDQYLTVTGPGVWLPLLAVIVLLMGAIVWMIFGRIDVHMQVAVEAEGGRVICYVPNAQKDKVLAAGTVTIAGKQYTLTETGLITELVTSDMDVSIRRTGLLEVGTAVDRLQVDADLIDGVYNGQITVEAVNPIQYIIN